MIEFALIFQRYWQLWLTLLIKILVIVLTELITINEFDCSDKNGPSSGDPEGGTGGLDPPGKSQVIWVSIGNKQLDPPWKELDPPPPLENVGPPQEP